MADIAAALYNWSTTRSSNSPAGGTTIGTGLDDNLREIQGVMRGWLASKGADIASAATTDLGAIEGLFHDITGTTTITGLGTVSAGIWKVIKFEGILTFTHNATSLILPGGLSITTANGDMAMVTSEGSGNWRCNWYQRAAGDIALATPVASTSGTSIDFTGLPLGVKRVTVCFRGVSTDGSSPPLIQIGDSGGIEATGYLGSGSDLVGAIATAYTSGFGIGTAVAAGATLSGAVTLTLENATSNTWVCAGIVARADGAQTYFVAGWKPLSTVLDRVRITTVNGTDVFDLGEINVVYE